MGHFRNKFTLAVIASVLANAYGSELKQDSGIIIDEPTLLYDASFSSLTAINIERPLNKGEQGQILKQYIGKDTQAYEVIMEDGSRGHVAFANTFHNVTLQDETIKRIERHKRTDLLKKVAPYFGVFALLAVIGLFLSRKRKRISN